GAEAVDSRLVPGGAAGGAAGRDPGQDRPRGPRRANRGGDPRPPGGQPTRPPSAERPPVMDVHSPASIVRAARPDDHDVIAGFNAALALESEAKVLDHGVLARGVSAALADPDRLRYWVAEAEGRPVGQAAVTREWSDWRDGWLWWLQSVYVVPDFRRRGVFRSLYLRIRAEALAAPDVIGLRLYVEENNARAHRTYQALGMSPGGYHVYEELWTD